MKTPMKVDFDDTRDNWRLWGELVELWIYHQNQRPNDTVKLVSLMTAHGITNASVYGPSPRKVEFYSYGEKDPLVIELPTKEMLQAGYASATPGEPYPLPIFYDDAYDCKRKAFTAQVIKQFAACRVGEYTINQCM
jgi:hypothetical protein